MEWIEKLARDHGTGGWQTLADMVRFGNAVASAEREACATLCDQYAKNSGHPMNFAQECADGIRARKKTDGRIHA